MKKLLLSTIILLPFSEAMADIETEVKIVNNAANAPQNIGVNLRVNNGSDGVHFSHEEFGKFLKPILFSNTFDDLEAVATLPEPGTGLYDEVVICKSREKLTVKKGGKYIVTIESFDSNGAPDVPLGNIKRNTCKIKIEEKE